jgi:hypothetical protein
MSEMLVHRGPLPPEACKKDTGGYACSSQKNFSEITDLKPQAEALALENGQSAVELKT